jgi:chromate reductase
LRAAIALAPPGMEIEIADLHEIPLYNFDIEQRGDPAPVAALKERIRRADALLIATPEYQHGIPGLLKNALDWASRPADASPLLRKTAAIMGASPGKRSRSVRSTPSSNRRCSSAEHTKK